jgi:predicted RNase H-like HicB family nuclease
MKHKFTDVIQRRGKRYVAYVKEIPGVNTKGRTWAEAHRNLKEALFLVGEASIVLSARNRSRKQSYFNKNSCKNSAVA